MAMSTRCVEDDANEAKEVKELVNQVVVLGGKLSAGNILGPLAKLDLFGHGRQLRNALEKFDGLVEKIIKEHEDKREMKDIGQCAEDCKINGFDLKGKTRMLINPYSIQRDPNSWTDPEEFNPDRFMVDSNINQMEVKGQMFNYLPFGSGRRGCPASSLALVVVQAAIGALVQCFDWEVIGEGKINLQEDSGFSVGIASPLV
ncbi:hypothetical protein NC651_016615 [Populus alba x Populus x berolinensis]|nr:hypothetical protein NC651_016615 [Populus alba x Populus x berolinensis]